MQHGQVSTSCLIQPSKVKPTEEEVKSCIKGDQVLLAFGKKIPLLSSVCVEPLTAMRSKMLVVKGKGGEKSVTVLRDTGCSGIVVKRDLVSEDQFTGDFNVMLLIDNTARKVPIAKIDVDTPYLKGQVEAQCLPDPLYDLVIGNVPGFAELLAHVRKKLCTHWFYRLGLYTLSVNLTLFFAIQPYKFCPMIYLNTIWIRVTKMLRLLATDIHTQIHKSGVVR